VTAAVLAAGLTACSGGGPSIEAYAARLASALDAEEGGDLADRDAACVARAFVELVGAKRLRSVAPEPATLPITQLKDHGIDPAKAARLLPGCGVDAGSLDARRLQGLPGELVRGALAEPYAQAIAGFATFDGSTTDLTRDEAACVGHATVQAAGLDTLTGLGPASRLANASSLASAGLRITKDAAEAFGPAVTACGVQLRRILGAAFTRVTDQRVASCMMNALDDNEAGRFAYVTLVTAGQDDSPTAVGVSVPLPFESCGFFGTADQRAYVDAVVAALKVDPVFRAEGETATCVAGAFVSTVTPKVLDKAGISPHLFRTGDLTFIGMAEPVATTFVQAFAGCGREPVPLLIQVLSRRTLVTSEREACLTGAVEPVAARNLLVAMLTSGPDGPAINDARFVTVARAIVGCGVLADAVRTR
jgi:hypothetical protein